MGKILRGLAYFFTKKSLGRVVMPVQVTAHHPRLLWGYAQMEQAQMKSHTVSLQLKELASIRVATLIGCSF